LSASIPDRRHFLALTAGAIAVPRRARAADRVIRMAVADWVPGLGNPYASTLNGTVHPFTALFDALTWLDGNGVAQPGLALSWVNESATTWRFALRPDVRFANGEPCDAAAVVAMIAWLKSPAAQRYVLAAEVKGIADAAAVDPLTVRFTTTSPDVILPKRLSLLMLVPPAYWAKVGPEGFAQAPIGTGAFVLTSWGRDRGRWTIARNPTAWRAAAGFDALEMVVLPEAARRAQAVATGEAEMAYNIDFESMDFLAGRGIRTLVRETAVVAALAFPNRNAASPLADVRVRRALNLGVDRAAIAKVILRDTVAPNGQGVIPGVFGHDPTIAPFPFDPEQARALLKQAGHGRLQLKAAVIAKGAVEGEAIYQQIAQDLAQIGVMLEIRSVTGSDWVQMWVSGDWRGADMLSAVWNGATFMDAARAMEPFTCGRPGTFFCDADVDALLGESALLFDADARAAKLRQALGRLHDLAPSLYLFPQPELVGVSDRVQNLQFRGRYLDWSAVTLAA
jgi:peptide/nickel transport system substrate-binding protein